MYFNTNLNHLPILYPYNLSNPSLHKVQIVLIPIWSIRKGTVQFLVHSAKLFGFGFIPTQIGSPCVFWLSWSRIRCPSWSKVELRKRTMCSSTELPLKVGQNRIMNSWYVQLFFCSNFWGGVDLIFRWSLYF